MVEPIASFESRTLSLNGLGIHYLQGGRGSPLVLIHGLGSAASLEFQFNLEAFATAHQVLAVDLPGFGQSDKPAADYSISFFINLLLGFLASQRLERAAVLGVSHGGRIALGLALQAPRTVERLVLVDALGVGAPRRVLAYQLMTVPAIGELILSGTAQALRRLDPRLIRRLWGWYLSRPRAMDRVLDDDRILSHRRQMWTPGYRTAYLRTLRSVAGLRRLQDNVTLTDRLRELSMPTLLAWGRHDRLFPVQQAAEAAERIPRAQFVIFEHSGHTPQMEESERFNQVVLDFLA